MHALLNTSSVLGFLAVAFASVLLSGTAAQAETGSLFQLAEQPHMASGHALELAAKCGAGACGGKTEEHKCGSKDKDHSCGSKDKEHTCGSKDKEHTCGSKDKEHTCGSKSKTSTKKG